MADVASVTAKVQELLTSQAPVQLDEDGDFSIAGQSSRVFVRVMEHPHSEAVVVSVFAPVLVDVPITPELCRHVALNADTWLFGHLALRESEEGRGEVIMAHRLLGDELTQDELMYAVAGALSTADAIDEQWQEQFGGKRFSDLD